MEEAAKGIKKKIKVKKQVSWVQPPTARGSSEILAVDWEQILDQAQKHPQADVKSWDDIDRLDVRPSKGVIKVRCKSRWEIQIDSNTGEQISAAYRRSDLIESLHDGSFFSDAAKLWLFLPNGLILLGLWVSGGYLWYIHFQSKRKKKKRIQERSSESPD